MMNRKNSGPATATLARKSVSKLAAISIRHVEMLTLGCAVMAMLFVQRRLLSAGLFWDDHHLFQNEIIKSGDSPYVFWARGQINTKAWPLFFTLMWMVFSQVGNNLFFFHAMNVILHAVNGVLLYKIAKRMKLLWATVPAVVFLLHPLVVEPVSWIFQFSKILSTFFLYLWFLASTTNESGARRLSPWPWLSLAGALLSGGFAYLLAGREISYLSLRGKISALLILIQVLLSAGLIYLLFLVSAGMDLAGRDQRVVSSYTSLFSNVPGCKEIFAPDTALQAAPLSSADQSIMSAAGYAAGGGAPRIKGPRQTICFLAMRVAAAGMSSGLYLQRFLIPINVKIPQPARQLGGLGFILCFLGGFALLVLSAYSFFGRANAALTAGILTFLPISGLFFFTWLNYSLVADRLVYVCLGFFLVFLWGKIVPVVKRWKAFQIVGALWLALLLLASMSRAEYILKIYQLPIRSIFYTPAP